jgi:transcriptional regulator with XRE-family HTH domain
MRGRPPNIADPGLAQRLSDAKAQHGFTNAEIADRLRMSPASYYRCMKSEQFSSHQIDQALSWLTALNDPERPDSPPAAELALDVRELNKMVQKLRKAITILSRYDVILKPRRGRRNKSGA